eukprot:TRINITY_DN4511_c0_g2_i2.p1 TRINITY_DN4511_c0_g2~~TRINITY_DN4511_c0_g2_i2.p1  ORF type:complete len:511 (+),score=116.32 TRINITY_DN4511_c0_g2_i2:46-1578(+)
MNTLATQLSSWSASTLHMNASAAAATACLIALPLLHYALVSLLNGPRAKHGEAPLFRGWIPFMGHALDFAKDASGLLRSFQAKVGDVFTLVIAGRRMTFVLDPHAVPAILKDHKVLTFNEITREVSMDVFKLDPHLYEKSDTEIHQIYNRHLQGASLKEMTTNMQLALEKCIREQLTPSKEWAKGSTGLYAFCHRMIFESSTNAIFGENFFTQEAWVNYKTFDEFFPLLMAGLPGFMLKKPHEHRVALANHLTSRFDDKSCTFIEERKRVLQQYTKLPNLISDYQFSMVWASQANTIPSVFWTVFYIVRDEELLRSVLKEIEESITSAPAESEHGKSPSVHFNQSKLVLIDACINESLRLTSYSMTLRRALEEYELKSKDKTFLVRKGDMVVIYPNLTHMDPEIFPEPEKFNPYRFAPQLIPGNDPQAEPVFTKDGKVVKNALMPFGGGVSLCPGRFFARNEIKMFVVLLLHFFDIRIAGKYAKNPPPSIDEVSTCEEAKKHIQPAVFFR